MMLLLFVRLVSVIIIIEDQLIELIDCLLLHARARNIVFCVLLVSCQRRRCTLLFFQLGALVGPRAA